MVEKKTSVRIPVVKSLRSVLLLLCVFPVLPRAHAATINDCDPNAYYFVTTDHTGAQTQIDINHKSVWTFNPGEDFSFGGGIFVMKDGGSAVVEDIVLTALDQNTGYSVSLTLTPTDFTQQFNSVYFLYPTPPEPITITAGHDWTISLTSQAQDHQSTAYFIKGFDQSAFYLGGKTTTDPLNVTTTYSGDVYSSTPEPASWLLMAGGIALAALLRNRIKAAN